MASEKWPQALDIVALILKQLPNNNRNLYLLFIFDILGGEEQLLLNVEEDEEFDWQIEQEVPVDERLQVMIIISIMLCAFPVTSCNYQKLNLSEHSSSYGFAEQHSAVFIKLQVCIRLLFCISLSLCLTE